MLTPEFENSAHNEPYSAYLAGSNSVDSATQNKLDDYSRDRHKKFVDNEYARIENAIHDLFGPGMPIVWHGIFDPLTNPRRTTTATNSVPDNIPCEPHQIMDAEALEIQMLENELAEIEAAIQRKNEHQKKVISLQIRISEAKQFLNTI